MKAAIYARYSSDNQREESIDAQIRAIQEYCKKNGHTIVKIYVDEAKSATTDNRPNFLNMIDESKLGLFDVIIVHKLDRFARNRYDSAFHKKRLKDNGVRLISVLENLDNSPESIILESVLEGMAEYYSQNLSREVMKGMKETALQAKHNGGVPPLGYDVAKDKTYTLNLAEAEIIQLIFTRYVDGYGYQTISNDMNRLGYSMKSGKPFTKGSIRSILMNEKYTGTYVFNRRADGKMLNKIKPDDEIIRVPDALPQIITREIFEKVQVKLNGLKTGKRHRVMNYLLTGKLFCGECSSHYTGAGHTKGRDRNSENPTKYYKYACTGRKCGCKNKPVNKETIEQLVISQIKEQILNDLKIPVLADELSEMVRKSQNSNETKLQQAKSEVNKLKSQIEKDFQLYYDDLLDKTVLAERINSKKEIITQLEHDIIILESKNYSPEKEKILKFLCAQKELIDSKDDKLHQKVINTFVQCVIIHPDRYDIDLGIDNHDSVDSYKVLNGSPPLTISLSIMKQ